MSKKKTVSKNNSSVRGTGARKRFVQGKPVLPIWYISSDSSYIAAKFEDGNLAIDQYGNPLRYKSATFQ